MDTQQTKKNKGFWLLGIVAALVLVGLVVSYEKNTMYAELNHLKLIPEPERFTELYFENASSLPQQTVAGKPIIFSFTVHNLEGATTTYPYRVYFQYPDGHQTLFRQATLTLVDTAFATINISHTFLGSDERGMVVVELTSLDQSIDFLLPDTNY
jgi:hypothetical protein